MNNLTWIKTVNGGSSPAIAIERSVFEKVAPFIAKDEREFHDNPDRCVIPAFDSVQSEPLRLASDSYGYDTLVGALLALVTGWHFVKPYVRRLYYANSEGLHLIAEYGSPRKAYASLR
ncbi:MAG TPA: hypothetical protein VGO69_05540 [Pyrinomonadaceae bacterium]|jgi:hypothetical protein|nr:hypothetical protein [Pyrinomonadaceae bacterium]